MSIRLLQASSMPARIEKIYLSSFPEDERRPIDNLREKISSGEITLYLVVDEKESPIGFITFWNFDKFRYAEHFAIDPGVRGSGFGAQALHLFLESDGNPVILEVEPAGSTPDADRRISFYNRNGLEIVDRTYVQPPYSVNLPSVPLFLMSDDTDIDTKEASAIIKKHVYCADKHQSQVCTKN